MSIIADLVARITELERLMEASDAVAYPGLADSESIAGDLEVAGTLTSTSGLREVDLGGTDYTSYLYVPLTSPLTSTSFDGDSFSDTAKTKIDLSSEFGAPGGIAAIQVYVAVRDSGAAANDTYMFLGPTSTADQGIPFKPLPVNDRFCAGNGIIPCDSNGDIYYQIEASGSNTFDVLIQIWGYFV